MNDRTYDLLNNFFEKLGTTSKYIWGVLINQAKMQTFTDCFLLLILIALVAIWFRFHRKFSATNVDYNYGHSFYYENEGAQVLMAVLGVFIGIGCILGILVLIPEIVYCIGNPEYWALDQILSHCKK